jgi:hypothetical protein
VVVPAFAVVFFYGWRLYIDPLSFVFYVHLLTLLFVSVQSDKSSRNRSLRRAWITFALIPVLSAIGAALIAVNLRSLEREHIQIVNFKIELFVYSIGSVIYGISLYFLAGAIAPDRFPRANAGRPSMANPPVQ